MIRAGVIGTGFIGPAHIEALRRLGSVEVVALAETPLAMTSAETGELVQALSATHLVGAVCFNYRMYPLVQEARVRAAAGELGELRLIHGCHLQDWLLDDTDFHWRVDARLAGASRAMADIG